MQFHCMNECLLTNLTREVNEMKKYLYSEITEIVNPEDVDLKSFELKDKLNDEFWHDGKLDIYVRKNLLQIAKDFVEGFEIDDIPVEDVILTGSLANYNWNEEYSDIDLHVISDFTEISDDKELVKKYFDAVRKAWNQKHEGLKIYGYPVEIYMQDKNEKHTSTGVYSVLNDEWVIEPSKENIENDNLDSEEIRTKASEFMNEIDELVDEINELKSNDAGNYDSYMNVYDKAENIMDRIKEYRKMSFSRENGKEMTEGNLIFKSLRRNGYMEKIYNIKKESYDLANSL